MMNFSYNSRINSNTEYESISSKWDKCYFFNIRKHIKIPIISVFFIRNGLSKSDAKNLNTFFLYLI